MGKILEHIKYEGGVGCVDKKGKEERWWVVSVLVNLLHLSELLTEPLTATTLARATVQSEKLQETQSCEIRASSVNPRNTKERLLRREPSGDGRDS